MKLLYDISALAVWHDSHNGKRGIYRVVEETLNAIAKKTPLEVCATEAHTKGISYLSTREKEIANLPFRKPEPGNKPTTFIDHGMNLEEGFLSFLGEGRSLLHRVARRSVIETYEIIDLPAIKRERLRLQIDDINIFHQPGRFVIPEFIRCHTRSDFLRVSTLYDFIPYHEKHGNTRSLAARKLSKVLGSISKDDTVICISEFVRDEACERLGLPVENTFVSHLAACRELFYPCRNHAEIQEMRVHLGLADYPYFLALCALDERKNIAILLQAFSLIKKQQSDFQAKLVLAGSVSEVAKQTLLSLAKDLEIEDQLVITGFIADSSLAALYSGAVSFLFPSLEEGFGLPPLEAMQCGLPVISSNQTSLPEVVGDCGILLDPWDVEAWAAAIYDLSNHSEVRESLSIRGLARAKLFSWEKSADEHLEIYKTMLNRKSSSVRYP